MVREVLERQEEQTHPAGCRVPQRPHPQKAACREPLRALGAKAAVAVADATWLCMKAVVKRIQQDTVLEKPSSLQQDGRVKAVRNNFGNSCSPPEVGF